jgi:predicted TIM-barrel fold metal-dependent hydrolase
MAPASDPGYVVRDVIEPNGIATAILNSLQANALCAALASVDESVALAPAFNDFFLDRWASDDERFRLAVIVPSRAPAAAVNEIERVGDRGAVVAIALPLVNALLGEQRWRPIYQAAVERNLPLVIHGSGLEGVVTEAPALAGGTCDSYIERYVGMTQIAEANVASLVFSGVLEQFPTLKFVFTEFGFLWVLPLLWRMDRAWRQLRREVPWVQKSPIDYVHDQCFFTTQPMDEPQDPRDLEALLALLGFDNLCFSTDYPHWDNEMPSHVVRRFPPAVRRQVLADNARRVFRLN